MWRAMSNPANSAQDPTARGHVAPHLAEAPPSARSVLHVDLAALAENWRHLARLCPSAECSAVIKANAYGIGQDPAAEALWRAGCRTFFVASLDEALRARAILPRATIYLFDGLATARATELATHAVRPVLSSLAEVERWRDHARRTGNVSPAGLMLDTGMNRLGLSPKEARALAQQPDTLRILAIAHVMSHLACAEEPAHPRNQEQRTSFTTLAPLFPGARASLANSAGIFLGPDYHFDLTRPGIALYGGRSVLHTPNPMRTVASLFARILQVRSVTPGDTVGYGALWTAAQPARLATVASGYADGFLRCLSGTTERPGPNAYIAGHAAPIVGRVSMDLITLDVSRVPDFLLHPGAWVELIGPNAHLDGLADQAGTIGYEILTRLGSRSHRLYGGL